MVPDTGSSPGNRAGLAAVHPLPSEGRILLCSILPCPGTRMACAEEIQLLPSPSAERKRATGQQHPAHPHPHPAWGWDCFHLLSSLCLSS